MTTHLDVIRATYEGPPEENGRHLLAALAPEATWTEAAGFPYAGTYTGPAEIFDGVFRRLATEWVGYKAQVHTYLADGDRVAAFGVYSGTYAKTGKSMRATFAHLYRLQDGKILSMEQVVDSAMVRQALTTT
ncbi:nuclear transport factor 2 family protein [Variovorax arabinosiphilus]|uniref:nuclear transport factor 2 family protein n=1 Tax=Variovorax arabinosiphilus TaxID=3053498 RepID=UPI002575D737|nr:MULTISPECIES: nuclear transport factor 2 family protein [unclassified Variovorax]MDM0119427.1 nuclear transport factor 2 family protein [Variovorax sp. J2L1-78]MDM0129853.1 nuclear transport factor 2 family protein [Variovorax sp. J2L1-63]MDM0232361.1 nuclear transport factor 2 family protein [Variovorax sp. J2R1-6]